MTDEMYALLRDMTEEEQERIKPVLERDVQFQIRERERLQNLRSKVSAKTDECQLCADDTVRQGLELNGGAECSRCRRNIAVFTGDRDDTVSVSAVLLAELDKCQFIHKHRQRMANVLLDQSSGSTDKITNKSRPAINDRNVSTAQLPILTVDEASSADTARPSTLTYSTGQLPPFNRQLLDPKTDHASSDPNLSASRLSLSASSGTSADAHSVNDMDWHLDTVSLRSRDSRQESLLSSSSLLNSEGYIHLQLSYNCGMGQLEVLIVKCEQLSDTAANPYVKTYLYPENDIDHPKRRTKTKRHTISPVFNETLKYGSLTKSELDSRTLFVSVWHSDPLGKNRFLGEVRIDLAEYPWHSQSTVLTYPLGPKQERDPPDPTQFVCHNHRSIKICLKMNKQAHVSSVTVICNVVEARALLASDKPASVFVKGTLYVDERHRIRLKSPVIKIKDKQHNAVWNHHFVFHNQQINQLSKRSLCLTVLDKLSIATKRSLGSVHLNNPLHQAVSKYESCACAECTLWQQMIIKPNVSLDAVLPLVE